MSTKIKDTAPCDGPHVLYATGRFVTLETFGGGGSQIEAEMLRADFLAAVEAECDGIFIPRALLSEVTVDRHGLHVDGLTVDSVTTYADARRDMLAHAALAEHIKAHPPIDEAQVEALADAIREEEKKGPAFTTDLARALVAAGWSK